MDRCLRRTTALAALLATLASGPPVLAQVARSGGGNANAQVLEQMQQLASERTALQAENTKLKSQLADLQKDRDTLKSGQQSIERKAQGAAAALAHSTSEREATERELTQYKTKMEELIAKFRETVQKLRESETEGGAAKQSLAVRERELQTCIDHNVALYRLNDEVLTHFDRQGFWGRMAQSEPFLQIKRVRNENLIDDYRARAQEQLTPGAKPSVHGTGAASTPGAAQPPTPPGGAH